MQKFLGNELKGKANWNKHTLWHKIKIYFKATLEGEKVCFKNKVCDSARALPNTCTNKTPTEN